MKKLLISLTILCSFLIIDNVKALTSPTISGKNINFYNFATMTTEEINNTTLKDSVKINVNYAIDYGNDFLSKHLDVDDFIFVNNGSRTDILFYNTADITENYLEILTYKWRSNSNYSVEMTYFFNNKFKYGHRLNNTSVYSENLTSNLNYYSFGYCKVFSLGYFIGSNDLYNTSYDYDLYSDLLVYSKFDLKLDNSNISKTHIYSHSYFQGVYDRISIDKDDLCYELNKNDILFSYDGKPGFGQVNYNFNEIINTQDGEKRIHKLIVNFELPNEHYVNFEIKYDATSHLSKENTPIGYLTYKSKFDNKEINQNLHIFDNGGEFTSNNSSLTYTNYSDNFGIELDHSNDSDLLQLIIDFDTFDYNLEYELNFTSNIPFEVVFIEDNDANQNNSWTYIDLNGKYAVYLIPKILNTDIYAQFGLSNEMQILYLENYNDDSANKIDYGIKKNYFNKEFHFNNLNQAIKIINPYYEKGEDLNQYIEFNPSLFNYVIQDLPNYNIEIINPNTGESITTGTIDYNLNQIEEQKKINGINDLWKYLNKSLTNNKFFDYIKNIYSKIRQNYKIGNYFLLIIITSLIILLIKAFRR